MSAAERVLIPEYVRRIDAEGSMMFVPDDPPADCPACGDGYDSVSRHADGFVVNLLDNDRYRRVCFVPATVDGDPALDCFHHTHAEATRGKPVDDVASGGEPPGDAESDDDPPGDAEPPAVRPSSTERS